MIVSSGEKMTNFKKKTSLSQMRYPSLKTDKKPFVLGLLTSFPAMALVAFTFSTAEMVQAGPLFGINVEVDGTNELVAYDTIDLLFDALDSSFDLKDINPKYNDTAAANIIANFRGVDIHVVYSTASPSVTLSVPSLDEIEDKTFNGTTRAASNEELIKHLQSNQENIMTQVFQSLVATTASDPIAGNPASLQSRMIASDFSIGTGLADNGNSQVDASSSEENQKTFPRSGARLGRYTANGVTQTVIELPLSYTIPLSDPRYGVVLTSPFTYVETEGTKTFSLSLGGGLRVPVYDNWTITPALRLGATGSADLGSLATMFGASVTSSFRWSNQNLNWELGNMVGFNQTGGAITIEDTEIDYDLRNTMLRNGLSVSKSTSRKLFGDPTTWDFAVVNTQISGDEVFFDNYTDVSFSYGTLASKNGITWDSVRLGLTYTITNKDYNGFQLNFGYQF
jgi:hypothetical protein